MKPALESILVTGGCGFIGSNFIRFLFNRKDFGGRVVNLDRLTYAGNPENLEDLSADERYTFVHGDVADAELVARVMADYEVDTVMHFAAESHVDRSIHSPAEFVRTNIEGTFRLLEAARNWWKDRRDVRFHQVSTDEVFGSLGAEGRFCEESPYDPRSPYSASKAAADHLVRAYHHTYGLPVTLSNCSNNFGPYQFPEKLIPLMILNLTRRHPLPIYGDGGNIRDWLYVEDHCEALWRILIAAEIGTTWNIGGDAEFSNLDLVQKLCDLFDTLRPLDPGSRDTSGRPLSSHRDLITFVKDRPGHDRRYAIDSRRIQQELGWRPRVDFFQGLERTVTWYAEHAAWVERIRSGVYREWLQRHYGENGD
ncbi:MAG TPA: dTDP-glucose 4,6-dehydratase [Candidatus Aminicenantes bacterium]|nr:dTDP-glucose 4,6-dehydratase [Candidatus Aminicenantes bacterium]